MARFALSLFMNPARYKNRRLPSCNHLQVDLLIRSSKEILTLMTKYS